MVSPARILIVDDDLTLLELLGRILEPQGYELTFATRGQEALELLKTGRFNVAILDIMLPEINGMEILKRVQGQIPDTEVIVLTGFASLETAIEAVRLGAYDYSTKPFSLDAIRATVRRAVEKQRLETRLSAIQDLSREMALSLRVDQVGQAVLDIVVRVLELENVGLWLVDSAQSELYLLAAHSTMGAPTLRLPLSGGSGIIAAVACSGEPLYVADTREESRYGGASSAARSELTVPLKVRERVIGVLNVESAKADAFGANDERLLSTLAAQTAVAIENARLHEQAQQEIAERKRTEEALRRERDRAQRYLDIAEVMLVVLNQRGEISLINRKGCRVLGCEEDELLNESWFDTCLPARVRKDVKTVFYKLMAGEITPVEYYENPVLTKSGEERTVAWHNTVLVDGEGNITGTLSSGEDITDRKWAEEEIQQRNQELAVLNEIGQIVNSSLDLQETLTLVTAHTTRLLDVAATSLVLCDEVNEEVYFAAASGEEAESVLGKRMALGQGVMGWVVQHGEPALIPDVSSDSRWFGGFDQAGTFTTRSILCVPLQTKGRTIGAIEVLNKQSGPFVQDDLRLLSALAVPAASAIENARLFEQIRDGRKQLQSLSRRLVEVQEADRRHIARELHDETGQALSSMLLGLSLMEQEAHNPDAVTARVVGLAGIADQMLENLHRLAANLRPASLDYLGLVAALEQYTEAFDQQHGLSVQFETVGLEDERLPPSVETALYRIVQEALTNVVRHAQATRVDVLLERRGDQVVAIIEDDGAGFDPEPARQSGRLGLFSMQERAEMLGGALTIESRIGQGTTIFVEAPYVHPDSNR